MSAESLVSYYKKEIKSSILEQCINKLEVRRGAINLKGAIMCIKMSIADEIIQDVYLYGGSILPLINIVYKKIPKSLIINKKSVEEIKRSSSKKILDFSSMELDSMLDNWLDLLYDHIALNIPEINYDTFKDSLKYTETLEQKLIAIRNIITNLIRLELIKRGMNDSFADHVAHNIMQERRSISLTYYPDFVRDICKITKEYKKMRKNMIITIIVYILIIIVGIILLITGLYFLGVFVAYLIVPENDKDKAIYSWYVIFRNI